MVQTRSSAIEANGGQQLNEKKAKQQPQKTNGKKRANGSDRVDGGGDDDDTDSNGLDDLNPAKRPRLPEKTDLARWRLRDDAGSQTWHYLDDDAEAKKWPQSLADKYFLGLPLVRFHYALLSRNILRLHGPVLTMPPEPT